VYASFGHSIGRGLVQNDLARDNDVGVVRAQDWLRALPSVKDKRQGLNGILDILRRRVDRQAGGIRSSRRKVEARFVRSCAI